MARHFTAASSEKITLSLGALGFAFGPGTLVALIKYAGVPGFFLGVGSPFKYGLQARSDTLRAWMNVASSDASTTMVSGQWYLVVMTKATGNVAVRFHFYDYTAGTWTHENGGALNNSSVPATSASIGSDNAGTNFFTGDIAALGVWDVVLTDAQVETLLAFPQWWTPATPKGMLILSQNNVGVSLPDLSGGGANQSAITGTTISSTNPPLWVSPPFDHPVARRMPLLRR